MRTNCSTDSKPIWRPTPTRLRCEVVDLDKARSARTESADPVGHRRDPTRGPTESADWADVGRPVGPLMVDGRPAPSGPGCSDRVTGARRRAVVPDVAEAPSRGARTRCGWLAGHAWHTGRVSRGLRCPGLRLPPRLSGPGRAARFVGGALRWVADRRASRCGSPRSGARTRRVPEAVPAARRPGAAAGILMVARHVHRAGRRAGPVRAGPGVASGGVGRARC